MYENILLYQINFKKLVKYLIFQIPSKIYLNILKS